MSNTALENRNELIAKKIAERERKQAIKERKQNAHTAIGVLGVVVPFILAVVLARTFMDENFVFSFESFLAELNNIPVFDVSLFDEILTNFTITADWGAFNGLRDLLNVFGQLLGILQFLGFMLFNSLSYLISLVRIVFGF